MNTPWRKVNVSGLVAVFDANDKLVCNCHDDDKATDICRLANAEGEMLNKFISVRARNCKWYAVDETGTRDSRRARYPVGSRNSGS